MEGTVKKKYAALLCLPLILLLFSTARADAAAKQKHFLWKVRGGAGTAYILGSIHYLKKDMYPLDSVIEDAFRKSDVLAVEANINDLNRLDLQKLVSRAFYDEADSMESHVSPETYELLKKELSGYGIPIELLYRQRPWFAALTLTSLELLSLGFDPDYGIDRHFLSEAEGKKEIVELESLDSQIDLLASFSDADQESFLLYTLRDLHLMNKEGDALLRAWRSGDAEAMEALALKEETDARLSGIYERLLYERNVNMSLKILELLGKRRTSFVVIGAAHLIGTRGIIETLRRKGYTVEQL